MPPGLSAWPISYKIEAPFVVGGPSGIDEEDNELVVKLEGSKQAAPSSDAVVAQQWFSQDIFKDAEIEEEAGERDHEAENDGR
eukprot:scaffold667735_cov59-Prasinocladus_malaysianus.AAC.1